MSTGRADLRDARCGECGARCVPGQTHLGHNLGWNKYVLVRDWLEVSQGGYEGWDLVESGGTKHPPFVRLAIRNKVDKCSEDITREFDDVAKGLFHQQDFSRNGSVSVGDGEYYDGGWWFQRREDAYEFIRRYGGQAE